jgi:4-amino-4-deoxy-L-arabinose transferase-like glycosyltransferase
MRTLPSSSPEAVESGTFEDDEAGPGRWPKLVVAGLFVLILAAGLWIRLRNNGYGLPYVYNYDEATHFTSRAVNMFGGNFDPRYYQNPSGFTYLVYAALRLVYATLPFNLEFGTISQQFRIDPTPIWELARTVAALLAMAGVVATFFVARRFWGARVALIAMAVLAFSFLSVTYSRIAVTDVGTFLPVALAVWGILRVHDDGRLRWYLLAGAAIGLAVGFKYTCGLLLLPLVIAAAVRWWRDRDETWWKRVDLRYLVLAGAAMVLAFAITTPFFFVHPVDALYELRQQATAAGDIQKLGQTQQGGISYYLESFTWGFGWAAIVFAVVGAIFELRRDLLRGILLVSFPVALFLYMGTQTRYFGRWLLMIYPILSMLAGIGVVRSVQLLVGRWRGLEPRRAWALSGAAAGLIGLLVVIQPLASDVRTSNVLGRDDTRQIARDWLVRNYPDSLRIIIEPAVPDSYYRKLGKVNPLKNQFVRGFTNDLRRQGALDAPDGQYTTYAATLSPDNIDTYRATGFCLVMTTSLIRGRAEQGKVPEALAYYRRLERESTRVFHASPYKPGRGPVPLHYDFSYDYYPTAYYRPGGDVDIYRLNNCKQGRKRVPQRPYGAVGLQKGIGTSLPPN